jgi:hypothetical protein
MCASVMTRLTPRIGTLRPATNHSIFGLTAQLPASHDTQEAWSHVSRVIGEILRNDPTSVSFEEAYRYSYSMVLYNRELRTAFQTPATKLMDSVDGDELYAGTSELIAHHLNRAVLPVLAAIGKGLDLERNEEFLETFVKAWNEHTTAVRRIRDILRYMVRTPRAQARRC